MAKKRKKKLTTAEIMEKIIDKEQLSERKKNLLNEEEKKPSLKIIEIIDNKEKKWFEIPMKKEKFIIKEHENKFYAQYEGWKSNIWIGAYNTKEEIDEVIKSYVKETKKKPIDRNIKNIHSILIDL